MVVGHPHVQTWHLFTHEQLGRLTHYAFDAVLSKKLHSLLADSQANMAYSLCLFGRHQALNWPHVCPTPAQSLFQNRVRPPKIILFEKMRKANDIPHMGTLAPDLNQTRLLKARS